MYNHQTSRWLFVAAALVLLAANQTIRPTRGQNLNISTKVQARILHESKNLDLTDSGEPDKLRVGLMEGPETTTITKKVKTKIKKGRSDGRLSNLWSMFMPSSTANNDYEESEDSDTEPMESSSPAGKQPDATESHGETHPESVGNLTTESHDERLITKYSRPPRQDGQPSELMLTSSSGQLVRSSQQSQPAWTSSQNGSATSGASTTARSVQQSPVKLMTGSLSKTENGPNMNDIVSNIMNSMESAPTETSNESSTISVETTSTRTNPTEREEDEVLVEKKADNSNQTRSDNFERWLNKIQFQEMSIRTPPVEASAPVAGGRSSNPMLAKVPKLPIAETKTSAHKKHESARRNTSSSTELMQMAELLNQLRLQQLLAKKQPPSKVTRQQPPVKGGGPQFAHIQQQRIQMASKMQHPFQHQLKQHQSQLIHGIRLPQAQASTISVSTQDGASNTSLSFASQPNSLTSFMDDLMGPNEVSQVMNGTSQSGGSLVSSSASNSENGQNFEQQQSVYQSQDEILRQVTSAINFDQQQLNHRPPGSNHRRPGEPDSPASSAILPAEGVAKVFKVGASMNELIDPTTTTTTTTSTSTTTRAPQLDQQGAALSTSDLFKASLSSRQATNGSSSSTLGMDDIDKSFDLLADKLRQLAQQQQQSTANNSNQPSWLRRPPISGGNDLFSKLAANLTGQQQQSQSSGVNLDQLRDLLEKHEKSRNELKSSQETMAMLMQQLMQGDKSAGLDRLHSEHQTSSQPAQNPMANLIGGSDGSTGEQNEQQNLDGKQPHLGWTPVRPSAAQGPKAGGHVPLSPANMVKNRIKQQPAKQVAPMRDEEHAGDGFYPGSDLALMLANAARDQPGEVNQQVGVDQRLIGLPIAILKEEDSAIELPQAQLEAAAAAAAEQLLGANREQNQYSALHRQQSAPQADQLHQIQKLMHAGQGFGPHGLLNRAPGISEIASALPMIRSSPAGEEFSMKHQHNQAVALNNLASLLHEQHSQHQPELQNAFLRQTLSSIPENQPNRHQQIMMEAGHEGPSNEPSSNLKPVSNQEVGHAPVRVNQPQQQQQQQKRPVQQDNGRSRGYPREDELRLQRQPAQLMQTHQMVQGGQRHSGYEELPIRPDLVNHHHHYPNRPPVITTTTVTGGGPPVKLREVAFYRPFGFRQHHAITYQANPTLAAMFPALSGAHNSPRPSLLRHMSPIRSSYREGQRLLGPLSLAHGLRSHHLDPYGHHHLPLSPGRQHLMGRFSHQGLPMKRHSMAYPGRDEIDQHWPSKLADTTLTSPDMKVRHLDPSEIIIEQEGDELDSLQLEDQIKYLPMESLSNHRRAVHEPAAEIRKATIARPLSPSTQEKSRPPRGYVQSASRPSHRGRSIRPGVPFPFDLPVGTMTMLPCLNPTLKLAQNTTSTTPAIPATTATTLTTPSVPINVGLTAGVTNITSI